MTKNLVIPFAACLFLCLVGCRNEVSESTDEPQGPTFATLRSADLIYLDLDTEFNSWLITQRGGVVLEVRLQLKPEPLVFTDPGYWALVVRTVPEPSGVAMANEIDVRLFENYSVICCSNTNDPIGTTETADRAFLAVSGYVDFDSVRRARFDLNFQQEDPLRSGQVIGQIVNVVGCWNIPAGEGGDSGCDL